MDLGAWIDERRVWTLCIVLRLLNAVIVRTYFNPDEHWQALEVAHRIVFGYGHLTWEWRSGIRSYLHPLVFAALYKVMGFLQLDTIWLMARAPRLLQGVFAGVNDVYTWKLARRTFGQQVAKWTLICQLLSWFTFFCMVRTLSNSLETTLTTMALFYWPSPTTSSKKSVESTATSLRLALSIAWVSCAIRPTSAVTWLYVGAYYLYNCKERTRFLFRDVLPVGLIVLGSTCIIDRQLYKKWIFVPLNFLRFNVLSSGGDFYGSHPWHWYLTQGFPTIAFTHLPLVVHGIWTSKHWFLAGLIGWMMLMYGLLAHKEFRFILPTLPIAMMFAGYSLARMEGTKKKPGATGSFRWNSKLSLVVLAIVLTNLPVALYTSLLHQRGSEAVMEYLAEEAAEGRIDSVLFMTQCHATPFYSTLHKNVTMRFLDCSPSTEKDYKDESSRFLEDPMTALALMYPADATSRLPSHLVLFDSLIPKVQDFVQAHKYIQVRRFFNAHFPVDRELQAYMLVLQRATV